MKIKLKNNKIKIMQITDTHIGNLPYHEDDHKTFALIDKMISQEKPDLIIHTGDIMWSDGVKKIEEIFPYVMERFDAHKIPMAITFGNHEAESYVSKAEFRNFFEEKVEMRADKHHVFNENDKECYVIEVLNENDEVSNVLYVIDSGINDRFKIGEYDFVDPEQVEWFRKTSEKYKRNDNVKRNIIFQHIPVPEYWVSKENIVDGVCLETNDTISSPKINTGLFANMIINGEVWGMTVGHDHDNNFDSILHDIHLIYGQTSGYQAYGQLNRGCRIFKIDAEKEIIETYRVEFDYEKDIKQ